MDARASDVFIGRVAEVEKLELLLDAARAGNGGAVLAVGEAGIGKTRLATELLQRARGAGFDVLLGRSIDLVGVELPYQPFVEALRPLRDSRQDDRPKAHSQLQVFEETLALLTERGATAPVLLVLEDLHWADTSTLDLVVFLAHNLDDRRVLLLGTYRDDEPSSAERMLRLSDGVRHSGSGAVLELGPLDDAELTALVAARAEAAVPAALRDAIVRRSDGNPLFAEELLAASRDQDSELPRVVRDLLLQRVIRLDPSTQSVLRVAAAAGRDVAYPLLRTVADLPERDVRASLRQAVENGVLVADQSTGRFRFRHALLAEAIYATILPGEREELHALLAVELSRDAAAAPAELAPHWAAAGRTDEALVASVEAARQAEAVFGLAEALAHLERALALWPAAHDAPELTGLDLPELSSWAAAIASQTGTAPRAVELVRQAIELVGDGESLRAARLHESLAGYLHESGLTDAALAASERAVDLVPAQPPSPARAEALAALGQGLMLAWRFDESLPISRQALELARVVGPREAELLALTDHGRDLAYLGHGEEGLALLWQALDAARQNGDPQALRRAHTSLTDVLTMLGRPTESARLAATAVDEIGRYGIDNTVLVANQIEALLAIGDWDTADSVSSAALRAITANFPYMLFIIRADLDLGRGDFDDARRHLEAARATLREDGGQGVYDAYVAELALWERRWTDAEQAVREGLARARSRQAAQIRVWLCAKGLRAQSELAALAAARRDSEAVRNWRNRAGKLVADARRAAAQASSVTPNAGGWLAVAEAEHERALGTQPAESWSEIAATWHRLERPPLVAYCRWREAEALVASGASRLEASVPLRAAHAVAARIGARPLLWELESLAARARLDLTGPEEGLSEDEVGLKETFGLTPREAEVLALVARGYTNREIAATLVISVKTASVHVSHILRKLGTPNRREAAAVAHRLAPQHAGSEP